MLVLVALHGLRHSRTGRVLRALPANQRAASGYGVRVVRAKLTAFAISGFIAGLARLPLRRREPAVRARRRSWCPLSLVVFTSTAVGGLGSAFGAILGAAIVEGSTIYLPPSWQLFPAALGVLVVLILFPRGLAGLCYDLRDWAIDGLAASPRPPDRRAHRPRRTGGGAMRRLASLGAGVSLFPLAVLFSIELLDQATQSAFNVLTPNVRDAFHLTNAGILLIVAIAGAAALACTLPVAVLADRTNRVRIALIGAIVGAAFSIALGRGPDGRGGCRHAGGVSMGQAVIFPTHNSLLADYYPVPARPRIYSAHRAGHQPGRHRGGAPRRRDWRQSGPGGRPSSSSPFPSPRW